MINPPSKPYNIEKVDYTGLEYKKVESGIDIYNLIS